MGEEYNLPSGLAGCEYYNELTGESECRVPGTAGVRNKALIEALQQLHKLQRQNKNLARELTQVLRDYNPLQTLFKNQTAELETMAQHLNEAWSELETMRETLPKELATAFAKGFVEGWEASNCGAIIDLDTYPLISGEEYAEGVVNEQCNTERSA